MDSFQKWSHLLVFILSGSWTMAEWDFKGRCQENENTHRLAFRISIIISSVYAIYSLIVILKKLNKPYKVTDFSAVFFPCP
ncbi:MAG: hypothetical protein HNEKOMLI_00508 [Sodalis sp. Psp]|nr:hypothetical protein [Sodalis sp. Psp]MCR3756980.1 hypothetical protein [Sodalis sp. Ppy]